LGLSCVRSFSREFRASVLGLQYKDTWPLSPQYADGQCYYHDRVVEGPWRPSTMTFFLRCHDRSLLSRTTHMRGSTSLEIHRYPCLLVRSEGRWVSLHLYSFFVCICIFYVFLIYIIFCMPEYLMGECLLYADVGPM
jgi:hypothetical protein